MLTEETVVLEVLDMTTANEKVWPRKTEPKAVGWARRAESGAESGGWMRRVKG